MIECLICEGCGTSELGAYVTLYMNTAASGDFPSLCDECADRTDPEGVLVIPCYTCGGTGQCDDFAPCEMCDGTGEPL